MGGINVSRWLLGGVAAAAVIWVIEAVVGSAFEGQMETILQAHNLSIEMTTGFWVLTVLMSLIVGLVLVFFYAAARTRFGPGPRTAVIVGVAFYAGSYLVALLGYQMIGLYPTNMLFTWSLIGLVEVIAASFVGAWLYKED